MYAIIRSGGKQSKVRPGDVIEVELLKTDDEDISFTPLLVVDDEGTTISNRSVLSGMSVSAKILGESKGPKIDIFKYKNKTGYRRRMGHRQRYTQIQVTAIGNGNGNGAQPAKAAKADQPAKSAKTADSKTAKAAQPAETTKPAASKENVKPAQAVPDVSDTSEEE